MQPFEPDRHTRFEDQRFGALVSALRFVAAPSDEQAVGIDALATLAHQIRSGDAASPLAEEVSALELPSAVSDRVAHIDRLFDELVDRDAFDAFTVDALAHDPNWSRMRALAREALEELGLGQATRTLL